MKALPISVYRTQRTGDCTNGGISSMYDTLYLICDEGFIDIDEDNPPKTLVQVVVQYIGGKEYKHIEPYALVNDGCVGWMAGGNIGYSSDSRFSDMSQYPLSIHDRQESQELYDRMFD